MSLEMKGKLVKILQPQSGTSKTGKEWVKQVFVIDNGAKYNPKVGFNLFGSDKVSILGAFTVGEEIEVGFNLSSREYNGNYYTSADAWKIQKVENSNTFDDKFEGTTPNDLPF